MEESVGGTYWSRLPEPKQMVDAVEQMYKDRRTRRQEKAPPTPFQFVLDILHYVYCALEPDSRRDAKGPHPNPEWDKARSASLRCIAFLSWDHQRRVFLGRRVFPTFADFLSFSHVPYQWGILGKMMRSLDLAKDDGGQDPLDWLAAFSDEPLLLPIYPESLRLNYDWVLAWPIIQKDKDYLEHLQGALVFGMTEAAADSCRVELAGVRDRLDALADAFAEKLIEHRKELKDYSWDNAPTAAPKLLPLWRKCAQDKNWPLAMIEIRSGEGEKVAVASRLASLILGSMGNSYHGIIPDEENPNPGHRFVLIASSLPCGDEDAAWETARKLRHDVLQRVDEQVGRDAVFAASTRVCLSFLDDRYEKLNWQVHFG